MTIALTCLMAAMGRSHGIGGIPGGRIAAKIVVVLAFGFGAYALFGGWFALLGLLSGIGLSIGHGEFYAMRGANPDADLESWEKYPRKLWNLLGLSEYTPAYSWYMMSLKGFIIGLPLGLFALLVAAIWSTAYYISFRFTKSSALAEYLSAGSAGLLISCL
jgi:hypothetical protein